MARKTAVLKTRAERKVRRFNIRYLRNGITFEGVVPLTSNKKGSELKKELEDYVKKAHGGELRDYCTKPSDA